MHVIIRILKERQVICRFDSEYEWFGCFIHPSNHIRIEIRKRTQEYLVFALKKFQWWDEIHQQTDKWGKRGEGRTHGILLGQPQPMFSKLKVSFLPLSTFILVLNLTMTNGRTRRDSSLPKRIRKRSLLCHEHIHRLIRIPRTRNVRQKLKTPNRSFYDNRKRKLNQTIRDALKKIRSRG